MQVVVGRGLANAFVDVGLVCQDAFGNRHAKVANAFGGGAQRPKFLHSLGVGSCVQVALVEKLNGGFAAFSACSHTS